MPTIAVDTGYRPNIYQQYIHDHLKRFSILVCHRRFGKTILAINALIDSAIRSKKVLPKYGYIAPQRNQAKMIAWDYLKYYTRNFPGIKVNESELKVTFLHNSASVTLYGADNPDSIRGGYYDGVVLDEEADMKPDMWTKVVWPMITDRQGWVLFIGTPKGQNQFYNKYNAALKDPDWFAGIYPIWDTVDNISWLNREDIIKIQNDPNVDEATFRQEWECDFTASCDNTLITIDMVNAARGKNLMLHEYDYAPKVIGVDVARYGSDSSVIFRRQGRATWKPARYNRVDNITLANYVMHDTRDFKSDAVFIDGGRGEGVIDYMRSLHHSPVEIQFGGKAPDPNHYVNMKAYMWDKMKLWLIQGGTLPDDDILCQQLTAVTYSFDSSSRLKLESKQDLKKRLGWSPDEADALALTFAAEVERDVRDPMLSFLRPHTNVNNEYDVL